MIGQPIYLTIYATINLPADRFFLYNYFSGPLRECVPVNVFLAKTVLMQNYLAFLPSGAPRLFHNNQHALFIHLSGGVIPFCKPKIWYNG